MTQATKDAIADAETLRLAWMDANAGYDVPDRFRTENATEALLWQNGMLGHYIPHECAWSARAAASNAFRAVPELRG